jgi:hypothetical protein
VAIPAAGPTHPSIKWVPWDPLLRLGHEVDHLALHTAEVKNLLKCIFIHTYVFVGRNGITLSYLVMALKE